MAKKKLYRKPEIKQVKLVPEEAVLSGCKVYKGGANGSGTNRCVTAGMSCSIPGS